MVSALELRTCLLLIDNQVAFDHPTHWGTERSTPGYKENLQTVLAAARSLDPLPTIIHVQHINITNPSSLLSLSNPNSAADLYPFAAPKNGEILIQKHNNGAFTGTELERVIRSHQVQQLVICGLVTDRCVSTTTRTASDLHVTDYISEDGTTKKGPIILVDDATATFNKGGFDAETVHKVNIASLRDEFATIMTTTELLENVFRQK